MLMHDRTRPRPIEAFPAPLAPRPGRRGVAWWVVLVAVLVAAGAVYVLVPAQPPASADRSGRRDAGQGPVPVVVAPARLADVPVYLDGVGSARALRTVTVRPQVDGQLVAISFHEGEEVRQGDVLARIDPRIYQAQLDQTLAKQAQDEAQLANSRLDLDRYARLAASNFGSRQQMDTQKANVAQLEAQLKADRAAVENARTYLGYTSIVAPIEGRAGIRTVDEGNIVRASDPLGLVVLTQVRPISVLFSVPQQQLARIVKAQSQAPLAVEAMDGDGHGIIDRGTLKVVDNVVDQTTGTVRLKAEFPNAELRLWPGAFVELHVLIETLRGVVVVPTAAVQRGPNGTFVYVPAPGDGSVAMRPVAVTYQDDETSVVGTGLDASERVVTTGFGQLADGKQIRIVASRAAPGATDERPRPAGGEARAAGSGEGEHGPGGRRRRLDAPPPAPSATAP